MFPSSSNSCSNPFSYTYEWSFANDDVSPNISRPAEEHTGSSFLHFPSPFLGNDELLDNHFFSQHQLSAAFEAAEDEINTVQQPRLEQTQDRKGTTGKKDRHSKIYTAHGPRDRRMRLSLQIARKFFDLQDMLGFDKASNTIEWLFAKSKTAIIELIGSLPQVKPNNYSVSVCEEGTSNDIMGNCDTFVGVQNDRKCRKSMFRLPVSKICRDKARARARERTREKKYFRSLEKSKQGNDANPNYLEQAAGSSSLLFELGEASTSPSQDMNYSSQKAANEDPVFTHLLLEHQMGTAAESRDGTYCNEDFMGFQDDWSMENNIIQPYYDHIDSYFTGDLHQPDLSFTVSIPEN